MLARRSLLLSLPILLAACEVQRPLQPETTLDASSASSSKADNSNGLFRIESPMFPFYSRTEPPASVGGYGYRTDEWAAVVFYRDPACVPDAFNLFAFYDVPGAFGCATTVEGFALHVEPFGMTPPKISQLSGGAVPIWFVPWTGAFAQAVQSGELTMAQLETMPGLVKGIATSFREHLTSVENHPRPMININARGYLIGGGSFRYTINWSGLTVADVKNVKIEFN